jgi:hypothetical protein
VSGQELAEIRSSLQNFSQQIAKLDTRLVLMEEILGGPPQALSTTSMPKKLLETNVRKKPQADRPDESGSAQEDFTFCRKWAGVGSVVCRRRDGTVVRVGPAESMLADQEGEATNEPPTVAVAPVHDLKPDLGMASSTAILDEELAESPESEKILAHGIVLGTASGEAELTQLWREFLSNHAAFVAGLEPRGWLGPDNKWRLIAGPFPTAREAEAACELLQKASETPCKVSFYAGHRI